MKNNKSVLGQNLVRARKRLGLTQSVVAEAMGLERSRYAHYEKDTTPSADNLRKLATILRVTTDELLYSPEQLQQLAEAPFSRDNLFSFGELNQEEKKLVLRWRLLSQDSKETVLKNIETQMQKADME